ncbi:hypothetical protein Dsin_016922 [Dipteronia sinensis]|uniref:Uncharacterized protein n=1 Tax=Dipteronia sinensis TaxID=43782 RepID=A0AAE0AE29_9ROSI|nr:hypothetical protein Dsin_016922 [Dipteronia sinensis]
MVGVVSGAGLIMGVVSGLGLVAGLVCFLDNVESRFGFEDDESGFRQFLVKGLVGNGASIKVFSDPWLPRKPYFLPAVYSNVDADLKVCDLIIPHAGGWNVRAIFQHLLSVDKEIVLSIPIFRRPCVDKLI